MILTLIIEVVSFDYNFYVFFPDLGFEIEFSCLFLLI